MKRHLSGQGLVDPHRAAAARLAARVWASAKGGPRFPGTVGGGPPQTGWAVLIIAASSISWELRDAGGVRSRLVIYVARGWQRLAKHPGAGEQIYCEIYEAIEKLPSRLPAGEARPKVFRAPPTKRKTCGCAMIRRSGQVFQRLSGRHFKSEVEATRAIERVAQWLDQEYPAPVSGRFRSIIKGFVQRHGLHYRLAEALSFRPSVSGILCGIIQQLEMGEADHHLGI